MILICYPDGFFFLQWWKKGKRNVLRRLSLHWRASRSRMEGRRVWSVRSTELPNQLSHGTETIRWLWIPRSLRYSTMRTICALSLFRMCTPRMLGDILWWQRMNLVLLKQQLSSLLQVSTIKCPFCFLWSPLELFWFIFLFLIDFKLLEIFFSFRWSTGGWVHCSSFHSETQIPDGLPQWNCYIWSHCGG